MTATANASSDLWHSLARTDPDLLADAIGREHLQVAAFVLSSLAPDCTAALLSRIPESMALHVLVRMARIGNVAPMARQVAERTLRVTLAGVCGTPPLLDATDGLFRVMAQFEDWQFDRFMAAFEVYDTETAAKLNRRAHAEPAEHHRLPDEEMETRLEAIRQQCKAGVSDPNPGSEEPEATTASEPGTAADDSEQPGTSSEETAIRRLAGAMLRTYDRIPAFEMVVDRWVGTNDMLGGALRRALSAPADACLEQIFSIRFGDWVNTRPLPAMLAVFTAGQLDGHGLLMFDAALIAALTETAFGGRQPCPAGTRPLGQRLIGTPIDHALFAALSEAVLAQLAAAFAPTLPAEFSLDRIVTNPRFATIGPPIMPVVRTLVRVDTRVGGGNLELVLPYSVLDPLRHQPLYPQQARWRAQVEACVNRAFGELERRRDEPDYAPVKIDVHMGNGTLTFGDLKALEPGAPIVLDTRFGDKLLVYAANNLLGRGEIVEVGGHVGIVVTELANTPEPIGR